MILTEAKCDLNRIHLAQDGEEQTEIVELYLGPIDGCWLPIVDDVN